jgi:hypothetical protein
MFGNLSPIAGMVATTEIVLKLHTKGISASFYDVRKGQGTQSSGVGKVACQTFAVKKMYIQVLKTDGQAKSLRVAALLSICSLPA